MLSRADRVIGWIERYCTIPSGARQGQPFLLEEFQKEDLRQIYVEENPPLTAIISMPKKNGKTTFMAALELVHIVGPESYGNFNSEVYSSARALKQAAMIFKAAQHMIEASPDLTAATKVIPTSKKIIGLRTGVTYEALSNESGVNQGVNPVFCVVDELGECTKPTDKQFDYLSKGMGAHKNSLMIIISTEGEDDECLLSSLIDDARAYPDEETLLIHHGLPKDYKGDIFSDEAIRIANPGIGTICGWRVPRKEARQAKRIKAREASYRRLHLNQRVRTGTERWLTKDVWDSTQCDVELSDVIHLPCNGGLDLSQTTDATSLALAFGDEESGITAFSWSWITKSRIKSLEKESGAPIQTWVNDGHLRVTNGAVIDYEAILAEIVPILNRVNLNILAYDSYGITAFRNVLLRMGQDLPLHPHGQGLIKAKNALSMPESIKFTEGLLLKETLRTQRNPYLTWTVSNAVATSHPNNPKDFRLTKEKRYEQIDAIVALVMALGASSPSAPVIPKPYDIAQHYTEAGIEQWAW